MTSTPSAAAGPGPVGERSDPGTASVSGVSAVSSEHPGINELFALLAYGEVAAFYRLTEEARMAPNLLGRINMTCAGLFIPDTHMSFPLKRGLWSSWV